MKAIAERILPWGELFEPRAGTHLTAASPLDPGSPMTSRTRLRDLRRSADDALAGAGLEGGERAAILARFDAAVEELDLAAGARGAVVFATADWQSALALPFAPATSAYAGGRFRVRPALPLVTAAEGVYVVALSAKRVRALAVDGFGAFAEVPLPGVPTDFTAATGYVYETQRQAHSSSNAALGRGAPVVSSHGGVADDRGKVDLRHFFDRVAEKLLPLLDEPERPVVLATTVEDAALFRDAARDPRVLAEIVAGNPDHAVDGDLAVAALSIAASWRAGRFAAELARARERRRLLTDLGEILAAAEAGRVASLALAPDANRWGEWDGLLSRFVARETPHPGDEDLLDRAAYETLRHAGHASEAAPEWLPERTAAVAILRY